VSLWSLIAAPLIFSGDMIRLDDFTRGLLCNDEVIDVDQDSLGRPGRRVAKENSREVWARELADGSIAAGLFNRGDREAKVAAHWSDLGLTGPRLVRDLWRQKNLGVFTSEFQATVGRHGVVLVRILAGR
jgi:alpha-galactosidase